MSLQAKVLRAIEEKAITPVGEHRAIPVDFRLISATNEDPQELIRSGKLREDLYHRVAAVEIAIPPLRERSEDIPVLVLGLLQQISKKEKKPVAGISKKLLSVLSRYPYPGNIRELINLLNSMIALAHPGEMLDLHLVPAKLLQPGNEPLEPITSPEPVDLHGKLDELSKTLILRALHHHNWNMTAAAKALGITRFGLRKMMKRLAISQKDTG
jgi:transcriptional regulator with PAS, ATPase and Fis domain